MKMRWIPMLTVVLVGCGDFVDDEGRTSFRQVAEGLQTFGDRVAEMGEALERDADVAAVPWRELANVLPSEVEDAPLGDVDGEDATDRSGAGFSMVGGRYAIDGDTLFVGVADLGALRGGAELALRWVAPAFTDGELEGEVEEIRVGGYPAIRVRDDHDGGMLFAVLIEGRFAVVAGAEDDRHERLVRQAIDEVDTRTLRRWREYGTG